MGLLAGCRCCGGRDGAGGSDGGWGVFGSQVLWVVEGHEW